MAQCPEVSVYTRDGVGDWTYHCPLEEDHGDITVLTTVDGEQVEVFTPSPHQWTLDEGQDPVPADGEG